MAARTKRTTPSALNRLLHKHLPAHLAEVLVPAVGWRVTTKRATAVVPNQVWEDLFTAHASELIAEPLAAQGLELAVQSRADEVDAVQSRRPRLSNFLQDPGNQFALSAGRQTLEAPGLEHNPLYLHGPAGCGKSHLLNALAAEAELLFGSEQVMTLDGHTWVAHQAQELAEHGTGPLRERIEQSAYVVFDSVEALGNRSLAQEQLFHLINNCMESGQQLVLAGGAPPRKIPGLEDRLVTRLSWGLAVALDPPMLETRLALLRQLAGDASSEHGAEGLARLVEALAPDMRQTVLLSERLMRGERLGLGKERASFDRVLECVARRYSIRPGDIAGKRRHRSVAQARQTCLLLGRRLTGHSLEALGGMVGGRDHSTVLYSIRQAEERLNKETEFGQEIAELTQEILTARPGGKRQR
ncbi:MAG: DnaA/Hda family protein [Planctomycetota bacterium]|jgi:chromosomal replication initiator protein|nr:DnaA/Hda family protein [Planctomycetota bacterium]